MLKRIKSWFYEREKLSNDDLHLYVFASLFLIESFFSALSLEYDENKSIVFRPSGKVSFHS